MIEREGKKIIKISAYQGRCFDDFDKNLKKVYEIIDEAGKGESDFLCFPEAYLSNYKIDLSVQLDDPRVLELIDYTRRFDMVIVVGICERESDKVFITALVLYKGEMLGKYRKTMLAEKGFSPDYSLPVFEAKGIRLGVIICHDSSFVEPALTIRWKGARILFSPHYNSIPYDRADEHRILVRNNHIGLAALLQMVVVRSNMIGGDEKYISYGDSAIFSPLGIPVAVAPLFKETLISAEFDYSVLTKEDWCSLKEIPLEVYQQLWEAARKAVEERDALS